MAGCRFDGAAVVAESLELRVAPASSAPAFRQAAALFPRFPLDFSLRGDTGEVRGDGAVGAAVGGGRADGCRCRPGPLECVDARSKPRCDDRISRASSRGGANLKAIALELCPSGRQWCVKPLLLAAFALETGSEARRDEPASLSADAGAEVRIRLELPRSPRSVSA